MRLRHPLAAASAHAITIPHTLPHHFCGGQPPHDTQRHLVSASPLSRPSHRRYPGKYRLLTILERNPNVLPVHAVTRKMTWRKPFGRRIPSHGSLPPLPVRRTRFDTLVPSRKSFVALLLSETNIGTITSQRTFRSTLLEPTKTTTIPKEDPLAPLVFSANHNESDSHGSHVCAVPVKKQLAVFDCHRIPPSKE